MLSWVTTCFHQLQTGDKYSQRNPLTTPERNCHTSLFTLGAPPCVSNPLPEAVQTSIFLGNVRVPLRATKLPHMILNSKNWIMVVMIVYNAMSRGFPPVHNSHKFYTNRGELITLFREQICTILPTLALCHYHIFFILRYFFFPYITCWSKPNLPSLCTAFFFFL